MPTIEEFNALKEKIKNKGLVMSRVPENTRKEFIEFAEGEFAEDYGMCLNYIWDCFKHYQQIINSQDTKMNYIITMLEKMKPSNLSVKEEKKSPKFLAPQLNSQEVNK
jgi:hypothetical protein